MLHSSDAVFRKGVVEPCWSKRHNFCASPGHRLVLWSWTRLGCPASSTLWHWQFTFIVYSTVNAHLFFDTLWCQSFSISFPRNPIALRPFAVCKLLWKHLPITRLLGSPRFFSWQHWMMSICWDRCLGKRVELMYLIVTEKSKYQFCSGDQFGPSLLLFWILLS